MGLEQAPLGYSAESCPICSARSLANRVLLSGWNCLHENFHPASLSKDIIWYSHILVHQIDVDRHRIHSIIYCCALIGDLPCLSTFRFLLEFLQSCIFQKLPMWQ